MGGITLRQYFDASQKEDDEVVAVVEDVMDPLKLGRVRVRIPGFTDDKKGIPTDLLPWVNMKRETGTGTGKGVKFAVPAKGTKVLVKRTTQDDYQWTVTNELMTSKHTQLGLYQGNYPKVHGSSDADNTYHTIDMKAHRAFFHHQSKTTLEVIASGTVNADIKDDLNVQVDDHGDWTYDGYLQTLVKQWRSTTVNLTDTLWVKGSRNEIVNLSRTTSVGIDDITLVGGISSRTTALFATEQVGAYKSTIVGGYKTTYVGGYDVETVGGYKQTTVAGYSLETVAGYKMEVVEGYKTEAITGTHTVGVAANQINAIGTTRETTVGGADTLIVNGMLTITCVGGELTIASTGNIMIGAAKTIDMVAGVAINIVAPSVNIT